MIIIKELEKFIRKLQDDHGYSEIATPIMVKKKLFEQSGHWKFFKENIFGLKVDKESYALKPMNCPESALVYKHAKRSYRDLPLRLAEIGRLHRNELSGGLGGLLRVRQITMDDAHIYCREDQVKSELISVLKMTQEFYKTLDLPVFYGLATRPKKAMGDLKSWKEAEDILSEALKEVGLPYKILKGEGAFYGPKIHFDIKDSLERTWTIATAQLDFQMPENFKLEYTDEEGKTQRPAVIHRAIFGSFERFMGVLIEHFKGLFPLWLSPVQIGLLPVAAVHEDYAQEVAKNLREKGIRVQIYYSDESLGKRIREGEKLKIPYLLVLGDEEVSGRSVSVRNVKTKAQAGHSFADFLKKIIEEIESRSLESLV